MVKSFILIFTFSLNIAAACFDSKPVKDSIEIKLKSQLQKLINEAINKTQLNSLSITIGNSNRNIYMEAFGKIAKAKVNSLETIYDLASITKLFTASALLKKMQQKKMPITTKLSDFFPQMELNEAKKKITIENLLRHESGFKAGLIDSEFGQDEEESWNKIINLLPTRTYKKFLYSDINYLLLGRTLEKISFKNYKEIVSELITTPLRMNNTYFGPKGELCDTCAPTIKGQVDMRTHDPTAYRLGGVVGSAGLFTTIYDLSKFASLFLNKGEFCGRSILSNEQVLSMTLKKKNSVRGLGFDISSAYSNRPRGEYFSLNKSFGHTGYTGTSLWIDPTIDTFVIVLTNSVINSKAKKVFLDLNKEISTLVGKFYKNNKAF